MTRFAPVALLLAACSGEGDDKDGLENGPYCEDTPTVVALDEVTDLGFSGADVLALSEGSHDETLTWVRDDSTTPVALEVTYDAGEVRFVSSEAVYPEGTSIDIGVECEDRVEVDVSVSFSTDDGAFSELWDLALAAVSSDTVGLYAELDPDALGGTYDMDDDINDTSWDERSLWVRGTFDATGTTGVVAGQISGSDPDCQDGQTCTAWAGSVDVASWGESG